MSYPTHARALKAVVLILTLLLISACDLENTKTGGGSSGGGGSGGSGSSIKVWADENPTVVSVSPANLATATSVGGNVIVTFSTKIDPASITNTSFEVRGVTGTFSVTDNIVSFRPTSPALLSANTQYFVTLKGGTSGIKSYTGKPMLNDYDWSFTTGQRAVRYISPSGDDGNDGQTSSNPWKTFAHAFSSIGPGDELILLDGTYSEANGTGYISYLGTNSQQIPSGDSMANTTYVHALNPGKVFVQGRLFVGRSTRKDKFIHIDGITFVGGGQLYNTDHITITNSGFHGPLSVGTNDHDYGNTYNLIQDVWVWAEQSRIIAINYRADYNVWRRVVVRGDGCNTSSCLGSGNPNVGITVYESNHVSMQNIIVVDRILNGGSPYADFASAQHTPNKYLYGNNEWLGTISVNAPDSGYQFELDNNGTMDPTLKISNAVAWNPKSIGVNIAISGTNNMLEHITVGNSGSDGVRVSPDLTTGTLVNSAVVNAGRYGFNSKYKPSYVDVYNSGSSDYNQTSCDTGCIYTNPLADGTPPSIKYITRIESGSALNGAGSDGSDVGANVIYRYGIDGSRAGDAGYDTLSATALWPWPNEDRIKSQMCETVTRGFCAGGTRLDGVNSITLTSYIWEMAGSPVPSGIYP
jgi:hypothetical protein